MRKGLKSVLALVMIGVFLVSGCSQELAVEDTQSSKDDNISIGFSFDSFVIERWVRDRDAFVAAAEELGATVNVQCANGDVVEQIEQIRYLIDKKVDVLVVIPVDCYKVSEVIAEAKDAGIKVISYDRLCGNSDCDLYISFDNEEVGHIMGRTLVDNIEDGGKICIIGGPLTDGNVVEVEQGLMEEIDGHLQVVYTARCENWVANEATGYVDEILSKYPDVDGIMCGNDDIATQAFQELSANRKGGNILLTGQDGDLMAFQRIVSGTQLVSAFKPVEEIARQAATYAVKMAQGDSLSEVKDTINDGKYDIPYLVIMPVGVTKDNIDDVVIDGGYHTREEIYINAD